MSRLRSLFEILRWLGPWTKDSVSPPGIARERWVIREGRLHGFRAAQAGVSIDAEGPSLLDAYVYTPPHPPRATYVVSPGLHFLGPDDPRFDRFCRVLSNAGFVVVAPFLPSYVDLRVAKSAVDDLEQVLVAAHERWKALGRPTLFSISFGSWPAFEVAARRPDVVDGVITFGGYADFESVARFSVDGVMHGEAGAVALPRDPLNLPAVFLNILEFIDGLGDTTALERAFREMCYRTWGKMELKVEGRLAPFVDALTPTVPHAQRDLFRIGCGTEVGALELVDRALRDGAEQLGYLSPSTALERLACPVVVCHGKDDDVIPWGEATKLARALEPRVPTRLYLTGLFAHTGQGTPRVGDAFREVVTLLGMARTLASAGSLRETIT